MKQTNKQVMKNAYEKTAEIIKNAENKKVIFDNLFLKIGGTYGECAEIIAEFLRDCSTSFVSDIAKKYLLHNNCSEKQAWCMAFESIKISHMIDAWIEKEVQSMKDFENKNN